MSSKRPGANQGIPYNQSPRDVCLRCTFIHTLIIAGLGYYFNFCVTTEFIFMCILVYIFLHVAEIVICITLAPCVCTCIRVYIEGRRKCVNPTCFGEKMRGREAEGRCRYGQHGMGLS